MDKHFWDDADLAPWTTQPYDARLDGRSGHETWIEDPLLAFLESERLAGHFKPRAGVPLRRTPLRKHEVDIYMNLLNAK